MNSGAVHGWPALASLALWLGAALALPASAQQCSFRFFGTEAGLTNLAVKTLFQDRTGFLWAATESGLFRYDGTGFRRYAGEQGLPEEVIVSLGEAPDGTLLAGCVGGLYRLLGQRFEKIELPRGGVVGAYNSIRYDGRDITYLATNLGLVVARAASRGRLDLQLAPRMPGADQAAVHGLFLEANALWYGCGTRLCRSGSPEAVFGEAEGLPAGNWTCIRRDSAGDLWVADKHRFAVLRHGASRLETKIPHLPPTAGGGQFELDRAGRLLVPTTSGLAVQQEDGWRLVGKRENLRAPVYSVLLDREGSLWLGLAGRGLARWRGYGEWEGFDSESGLDSALIYEIRPVGSDTLWAGGESGLFRGSRHGEQWTWERDSRVGKIPVHAVRLAPDNSLWLGTEGFGVVQLDQQGGPPRWIGMQQGLLGESPYALAIDGSGCVWAGTEHGLFMAPGGQRLFHRVPDVPDIRVWTLAAEDNGDLVVGTAKGLYWRSGEKWRHLSAQDGLKQDAVLSTAARSGEIWVGYRFTGTLTRISINSGRLSFKHYGDESGVRGGMTYFIGFDAQGQVWSGTDEGVQAWDGTHWHHYDQNDGLIWNDCDLGAFAAEPNGALWIGTSNGLSHFTPHGERYLYYHPPPVIFTDLRLGNRDISGLPGFRAGYRDNSLVVRYSALSFAREASLAFRYRLKPVSSDWIDTGTRELNFPGLPPNDYLLEVQARTADSGWAPKTAAFAFTIQPPWWKTWWLAVLTALTAGGAFAGSWQWRLHRLLVRQKELEAAVAERTWQLRELAIKDGLTGLSIAMLSLRCWSANSRKRCARAVLSPWSWRTSIISSRSTTAMAIRSETAS